MSLRSLKALKAISPPRSLKAHQPLLRHYFSTSPVMASPLPLYLDPRGGSIPLSAFQRTDEYNNSYLMRDTAAVENAIEHSDNQGLWNIAVSRAQGKYLKLLVKSLGAKRVLEVGTLGGVSSIWMAQGLPDGGHITTLELSSHNAQVAAENHKNAGVADKVDILVGAAADTMKTLEPPFDFIFIDADQPSIPIYYKEAKRLVKSGGVIVIDNVVRDGRVADLSQSDPHIEGTRRLLKLLKNDTDVDATIMGFAGEKGYDGYMYIVKN